jgi:hypothetical protein
MAPFVCVLLRYIQGEWSAVCTRPSPPQCLKARSRERWRARCVCVCVCVWRTHPCVPCRLRHSNGNVKRECIRLEVHPISSRTQARNFYRKSHLTRFPIPMARVAKKKKISRYKGKKGKEQEEEEEKNHSLLTPRRLHSVIPAGKRCPNASISLCDWIFLIICKLSFSLLEV